MTGRLAALLLAGLLLFYAPHVRHVAKAADELASGISVARTAISASDYISALSKLLDEKNIPYTLSEDMPAIKILELAEVSAAEDQGGIIQIEISARGDGSALSGETIFTALVCAILAYSPADEALLEGRMIDLISRVSAQEHSAGLTLTLDWSADEIRLLLTPCPQEAEDMPPSGGAAPSMKGIDELIAYCSALLPKGWQQTSYVSGEPADVLLNIYIPSEKSDALWNCAHDILRKYWRAVRRNDIGCEKLMTVFYSSDMTPLLSLSIGRQDALKSRFIASDLSDAEFTSELRALAECSDAIVIERCAP